MFPLFSFPIGNPGILAPWFPLKEYRDIRKAIFKDCLSICFYVVPWVFLQVSCVCSFICLSNWKPRDPGSLGSFKGNIGISEGQFLGTFRASFFRFPSIFL